MPYNFVADHFHTKEFCSSVSFSELRYYTENGRFALLAPPPPRKAQWGLTYDVHLKLSGKHIVC